MNCTGSDDIGRQEKKEMTKRCLRQGSQIRIEAVAAQGQPGARLLFAGACHERERVEEREKHDTYRPAVVASTSSQDRREEIGRGAVLKAENPCAISFKLHNEGVANARRLPETRRQQKQKKGGALSLIHALSRGRDDGQGYNDPVPLKSCATKY